VFHNKTLETFTAMKIHVMHDLLDYDNV